MRSPEIDPRYVSWRAEEVLHDLRRRGEHVSDILVERAREIAEFLNIPEADAVAKLSLGFGPLHKEVNDDFRRANPQTDDELLAWYRATESYIWELTAYHLDPGFNYSGMCEGIAERLNTLNLPNGNNSFLCLGDGIGDLSMTIRNARLMLWPVYHDLKGSKTAEFAKWRFRNNDVDVPNALSEGWDFPKINFNLDAIISLDFLEHVTDVPAWAKAIYDALVPGGLFCAQNAFACGSGPNGAIPCHLERNDRFEKDWDPLLSSLGFEQLSSNWYRKAA